MRKINTSVTVAPDILKHAEDIAKDERRSVSSLFEYAMKELLIKRKIITR